MPLTDLNVRNAKAGERVAKLSDGGGLQRWIFPDGAKRWRLAYGVGPKQKSLAIGVHPDVGLKEARDARDAAKKLLQSGADPMAAKRQARAEQAAAAANTFETIAAELVAKKRTQKKADRTHTKTEWLLTFANAEFGGRPIKEIGAPDILRVLRTVAARGRLEAAKRLRATVGQVLRYAVATGRADADPTACLKGAIPSPNTKHRAAIVEPVRFGALLRAVAD